MSTPDRKPDALREALAELVAATDPRGDTPAEGWKSAWRKARTALSEPAPSAAVPARVALGDEQIGRLIERHAGGCEWSDADVASAEKFARAVIAEYERVNGITPGEQP